MKDRANALEPARPESASLDRHSVPTWLEERAEDDQRLGQSGGERASEVGPLARNRRSEERDAGAKRLHGRTGRMPGEQQGGSGKQSRDPVVRRDDSAGAGEQFRFARDERWIGAEIGDRRGAADFLGCGVEQVMNFGQRVAAHHHVEGATAKRSSLVEPRQPLVVAQREVDLFCATTR